MKEQNNNKKLSGSNKMKYVLPIFYLDFSQNLDKFQQIDLPGGR